MKNSVIILTLSLVVISVVFSITFLNKNISQENDVDSDLVALESSRAEQKKIKIAACPTCFKTAQKLNTEKYQVIPTVSTAESAALLAKGSVDMILAGRTLKLGEKAADFLVLADGYSFLGGRSLTVSADEIKENIIYSDIDQDELKQNFPDFLFQQVDDVYEYLGKGIVLTTWDNTDYSRAEIVHIIEKDGQRLALSRRPTLYCPTDCEDEIATDIKSVFN